MTRNLKVLGLALIAVFALSAVIASAASAVTIHKFTTTAANGKAVLTGDQVGTEAENAFSTKGKNLPIECNAANVSYKGTVGNGATEVTVHPTYGLATPAKTTCKSPLGEASIVTTGCNYIITGETSPFTNTSGVSEGEDATVHLECEAGKEIKVTSGGCEIKLSDKSGTTSVNQKLNGVKFTNEGTGSSADIKLDVTVDKIHYTTSGFACTVAGLPATGTDGFLTGKVTVTGFEDNAGSEGTPVGVSFS
jgi:hypothetical protein